MVYPKILDFDASTLSVKITENTMMIPELKEIVLRHGLEGCIPYIAYCYCMSAPDSPYINTAEDEKKEVIIYDIINTLGDFNPLLPEEETLLLEAIKKLEELYTSTLVRRYKALKISYDKVSRYIMDEEIESGRDGNLAEIQRIHKDSAAIMRSFKDLEKQVEEELKKDTRGGHEIGEY